MERNASVAFRVKCALIAYSHGLSILHRLPMMTMLKFISHHIEFLQFSLR